MTGTDGDLAQGRKECGEGKTLKAQSEAEGEPFIRWGLKGLTFQKFIRPSLGEPMVGNFIIGTQILR